MTRPALAVTVTTGLRWWSQTPLPRPTFKVSRHPRFRAGGGSWPHAILNRAAAYLRLPAVPLGEAVERMTWDEIASVLTGLEALGHPGGGTVAELFAGLAGYTAATNRASHEAVYGASLDRTVGEQRARSAKREAHRQARIAAFKSGGAQ